jgi:hypothetical protein
LGESTNTVYRNTCATAVVRRFVDGLFSHQEVIIGFWNDFPNNENHFILFPNIFSMLSGKDPRPKAVVCLQENAAGLSQMTVRVAQNHKLSG